MRRLDLGDLWRDNVMPVALGLAIGYARWMDGGGTVTMQTGAALGADWR